ncbi:uncharacterized protein LOC125264383 [Megalobrama amblycephala]|uniref:uncharacterized protein LOC125264383 n=1 Tax=Megalobrama amblycephala TaxID=75352 RepID=UPI0020147883|nr:uncharacterized protein LOC125264383 [Megalobrama amblycephala]
MDHHCRQPDSSDNSGASDKRSDLPPFNCNRNRPENPRSSHDAKLLNPGPPAIYRLNTERKYIDGTDRKVRRWTYGRRDGNKQNKVILIVGETGAGKTTLINTMINYFLGVKFDDQEFYQITDEEEENKDQSQSQTSVVTVYEVFAEKNPTSLTIIDTPGYGDTEGYGKDREISEYLTKLFSDKDGIHYIDAVCFVMKASQNRLSGKELYIFHSVLSLFGRDIENNIVFLLTHSDGGPPTDALSAINKAEIPCRKDEDNEPVHFLFNNRHKEKRDKRYERVLKASWEMGDESMDKFLKLVEERNRKDVQMTLDVLKERKQLEARVSNLMDRINEKDLKIKELDEIQEALKENRDKIERGEKFQFKVTKSYKEKVTIAKEPWWNKNATCCSVCEENCHEWECSWALNAWWCWVMKKNHCTVCTRRCHYTKHVRENSKYMMISKSVTMTFDDLQKQYERTGDQKDTTFNKYEFEKTKMELESNKKVSEEKTTIKEKLSSELEKITNEQSKLLHEAYNTIIGLSKIALKSDSAMTLRHLDFLINRLKDENKDEWIKNLEGLRKAGEEKKNKGAVDQLSFLSGAWKKKK